MLNNVLKEYSELNSDTEVRLYNDDTLAAFKEAEDIRKYPEKYQYYNSAQEMLDEII